MDDFTIDGTEKCTEEEWRGLFSSGPWKEFIDTCKMRLSMTRSDLETCDDEKFKRLQGAAEEMRFCLAFESIITQEFNSKKKEVEDERINEK